MALRSGDRYLDPAVAEATGPGPFSFAPTATRPAWAVASLLDVGVARAGDVVGGFEGWIEAGMPVEPYEPRRHALQGSDRARIRNY